jgi:hypothetical protein
METKPKRRWFRFSLRTLLVFVTIASAGFGWLGMKVRQAQRQRQVVEAIWKAGGQVFYDFEHDIMPISANGPEFSATPPGPEWVWKFFDVDFVANVIQIHAGQSFTDAELLHLHGLTKLELLDLQGTYLMDEDCRELQRALPNLKIYP